MTERITAGIDVGSNTVRLIIARVKNGRIIETLSSRRGITRLGASINETGLLSHESIDKTLKLFKEFRSELEKYNVERIFAAATSAVREASNSAEFLALANSAGIPLITITGEEEAQYTYKGVVSAVKNMHPSTVIYDIGGGSTEFIYVENNKRLYNKSIPTGVVKLSEKYNFTNVSDEHTHTICRAYLWEELESTANEILTYSSDIRLIGTAGTVTTIGAVDLGLTHYDPQLVSGHTLRMDRLETLLDALAPISPPERLKIAGLEKGREDLIVPGILLVQVIMGIFSRYESAVSDYGLREGLAIAAAERDFSSLGRDGD